MNNQPALFFRQMREKTVAFVGLGVSHQKTIELFARQGVPTLLYDIQPREAHDPQVVEHLESLGVKAYFGPFDVADIAADVLFRTPGMYYLRPDLQAFRQSGKVVTSEMEVFFDLCPCPIFAITGSDGKTTTTTLIAEMLTAQGKTVHLGGNIGRALLPEILDIQPDHVAVVELSSFQLLSMRPAPAVSVVTNIVPNHLDVHASMEEYVDTKKQVVVHQNAFSRTVLGADNSLSASLSPLVRGELSTFSLEMPVENGAYLKDGTLTLVRHGKETPIMAANATPLPGIHNVANLLTAMAAVDGWVAPENMEKVARTFGGVEHRLEFIRNRNGVDWYNDSIASSPTRSIAAIKAFSQGLTLIVGGSDKNLPYEPLAPEIVKQVKTLVVMGQSGPRIEKAVTCHPDYTHGHPHIVHADSMEQAVRLAAEHSQPGDVAVLSPASASFDLYKNFEHRGQHFKKLVHALDSNPNRKDI